MNTVNIFCEEKAKHTLEQIIEQDRHTTIRSEVAQEAIDHGEIKCFFKDLLSNGCACGMIPSLIYYYDTHRFFNSHYDEIEELREEYEDNTGTPLRISGDLKNFLAWFAFEEVAYGLCCELGLEL